LELIWRTTLASDSGTIVTEEEDVTRDIHRSRRFEIDFIRRQKAARRERIGGRDSHEAELEALAAASGVRDRAALEQLHAVGVRADSVAALALAPLIEAAWADGAVAGRERDETRAAAHAEGERVVANTRTRRGPEGASRDRSTSAAAKGPDPAGAVLRQLRRRTPWTVALRWCSSCGKFLGSQIWPGEAHFFIHTHGLCDVCFERTMRDPQ